MMRTWVSGSDGQPLSVRVDAPTSGRAKGSVVVVPPFGRDGVAFQRTMVALAIACADAGFVTWTVSVSGEGESVDLAGRAPASAWVADIAAVVDEAVTYADGPLVVVGVGMGAALATRVEHRAIVSEILWAPETGRQFVRRQRFLRKVAILPGVGRPQTDEFVGALFSPDQLADMRTITMADPPARARHAVAAESDERATPSSHPGQARIARDGIAQVLEWLPDAPERTLGAWRPTDTADFVEDGSCARESFVTFGPKSLSAVVTRPPEGAPATFAVVFTATASEVREGPGRAWVWMARRLARRGGVCVRADRRGIGDDVDPADDRAPNSYGTDVAILDDVVGALELASTSCDGPVIGVGLCSGAWLMLASASPQLPDALLAVNTQMWAPRRLGTLVIRVTNAVSRAVGPIEAPNALPADAPISSATAASVAPMAGVPRALLKKAYGVVRPVFVARPWLRTLAMAAAAGSGGTSLLVGATRRTAVTLVQGREEHNIFRGLGGEATVRALAARGRAIDVIHEPSLEHSLFTRDSCETIYDVLVTKCIPDAFDARRTRVRR